MLAEPSWLLRKLQVSVLAPQRMVTLTSHSLKTTLSTLLLPHVASYQSQEQHFSVSFSFIFNLLNSKSDWTLVYLKKIQSCHIFFPCIDSLICTLIHSKLREKRICIETFVWHWLLPMGLFQQQLCNNVRVKIISVAFLLWANILVRWTNNLRCISTSLWDQSFH